MVTVRSSYRRVARHISPVTGLVRDVRPLPIPESRGVFSVYAARHPIVPRGSSLEVVRLNETTQSSAIGRTPYEARALAVFEALERWSAAHHGSESVVVARYERVSHEAVHPNEILLFSARQYSERRFTNRESVGPAEFVPEPLNTDAEVGWLPAWSLRTGSRRYVPAAACLYGWNDEGGPYALADSRGVAAGPNLEFCVWNALLELIQTDAVAIWHANRLRRPLVDLTRTGDPYLDAVVAVHKRLGRELWVFDVTADIAGVWVFAAISRDCKTGQMVKGFGAHPEASRGLQRAVMECSQMLANVYGPTRDVNEHPASPCEAPLEQTHLLPPGTGEQLRKRLDAYRPGARTIQDLVVELGRKGMDVLVLDMTRPGIGLHTVRVIVPGLRSWFGRLAPGRLYDVPVALGERDGCLAECDLNRVAVEGGGRAEGFG